MLLFSIKSCSQFVFFELGEQLVERDNILEANGMGLSPETLSSENYARIKDMLTS